MSGSPLKTISAQWLNLLTRGSTSAVLTLTNDCSFGTIAPNRYVTGSGIIDVWNAFNGLANSVEVALYGTTTADQTFTLDIDGWRNGPTGPCLPVFRGAAAGSLLGTMICSYLPYGNGQTAVTNGKWCDTIAGTDCWPTGVGIVDSGTDRICRLRFDLRGCRYMRIGYTLGTAVSLGAVITAV